MIILKFGGTSLSSASRIKNVCTIAKKELHRKPILVVSAISGVTDLLLSATVSSKAKTSAISQLKKIHKQIIDDLFRAEDRKEINFYIDSKLDKLLKLLNTGSYNNADIDEILAFGEIISSYIIAKALGIFGIDGQQVLASDFIVTDNNFGSAEFLPRPTGAKIKQVLAPLLKENVVPVITGFIGTTKNGEITTLGRGGSDYSATIIGFCQKASEIQIWTDVDGIFTADPKIVKSAKLLKQVSYKEASELAAFGAKVLHPRTIKPAIKAGIPIRVLNSLNPSSSGTIICDKPDLLNPITAISYKKKIALVNIYSTEMLFSKGFLARIFKVFTKHNISVDLVSVSEVSVSVTLENDENLVAGVRDLSKFSSVSSNRNLSMVSLIGEGIVTSSNTIRKIFEILDKKKILVKMVSLGATDINISLVVKYDQVEETLNALHNKLLIKKMNQKG